MRNKVMLCRLIRKVRYCWYVVGHASGIGRESVVMLNGIGYQTVQEGRNEVRRSVGKLGPPALSLVALDDLFDALFCQLLVCVSAFLVSVCPRLEFGGTDLNPVSFSNALPSMLRSVSFNSSFSMKGLSGVDWLMPAAFCSSAHGSNVSSFTSSTTWSMFSLANAEIRVPWKPVSMLKTSCMILATVPCAAARQLMYYTQICRNLQVFP